MGEIGRPNPLEVVKGSKNQVLHLLMENHVNKFKQFYYPALTYLSFI